MLSKHKEEDEQIDSRRAIAPVSKLDLRREPRLSPLVITYIFLTSIVLALNKMVLVLD